MDRLSQKTLPIAALQPSVDPVNNAVRGIITLVWPYSASKQTTSILLAEPDFRLRKHKGQVRVEFHGSSAKSVARSGLTSGDEVVLRLSGVKWVENTVSRQTPGRSVDWELHFGQKVDLQVKIRRHVLELHSLTLVRSYGLKNRHC